MAITSQTDLYGNPIAYGRLSKAWATLQRPLVFTPIVCSLFGLTAIELLSSDPALRLAAPLGAVLGALGQFTFEAQVVRPISGLFFGKEVDTKYIETKPKKTTPLTGKEDQAKAVLLAAGTKIATLCGLAIIGAALGTAAFSSPFVFVSVACGLMPLLGRQIGWARQWSKVKRGDWVITNQKAHDRIKVKAPQREFLGCSFRKPALVPVPVRR
jgi:hypothetical protein